MVRHVQLPAMDGEQEVTTIGPPARPSGSIVPDSQYNRLGSVGPKTEQW